MGRRRPQILAERQQADTGRAQIPQRLLDLLVALPEPEHHPALRRHVRPQLPGAPQHRERARVRRGRPHAPVETLDGLEVVIEDVRARLEHRRERRLVSAVVGDQHPRCRSPGSARGSRARWPPSGPAPPSGRSSRATHVTTAKRTPSSATASATRSGSLGSSGAGPPGEDVAEAAAPRAEVPADHERGRAPRPALAAVRTGGRLADGVELLAAHECPQPVDLGRRGEPHLQPVRATLPDHRRRAVVGRARHARARRAHGPYPGELRRVTDVAPFSAGRGTLKARVPRTRARRPRGRGPRDRPARRRRARAQRRSSRCRAARTARCRSTRPGRRSR